MPLHFMPMGTNVSSFLNIVQLSSMEVLLPETLLILEPNCNSVISRKRNHLISSSTSGSWCNRAQGTEHGLVSAKVAHRLLILTIFIGDLELYVRIRSKRHFDGKAGHSHCVFFGHSWATDRNDVVQGDMRLEKWPSMMWLFLWIMWLQWCLHNCLGSRKTEFPSPDVTWKVVAVRDSDKGWSSRISPGNTICITWILEEPFWDCRVITNSSAVGIPEGFPSMLVLEMAQGPAASSKQHNPAWGTTRGAALEGILKELCRRIGPTRWSEHWILKTRNILI